MYKQDIYLKDGTLLAKEFNRVVHEEIEDINTTKKEAESFMSNLEKFI